MHFIPTYLLDRVAEAADDRVTECVRQTLVVDARMRERRQAVRRPVISGAPWVVHDAANGTDVPGRRVRSAGEPETGDAAVDEAAAGLTATQDLFADWGRNSYDGAGATALATVHYGQDYVNAFWDGTQLVFGDGDGEVFDRFTKPIEVLAHELAHALIQSTADLAYQDQSGALNESVADVVGACLRQRVLGQTAAEADWLIGAGLFLPGVQGRALRSMIDPGSAYDDPRLGVDPQPGHMDDFVETNDDNGGVHINSGIPNRAFVLAAQEIGGQTWQGAGRIWFDTLVSGIEADSDFATFAQATVERSGEHAEAVARAWRGVGVEPGRPVARSSTPTPVEARTVEVRRSGGITGMVHTGLVDLESSDPRASEVRSLLEAVAMSDEFSQAGASTAPTSPDRFVYAFRYGSVDVHVAEQELTDDLRTLAQIVLGG